LAGVSNTHDVLTGHTTSIIALTALAAAVCACGGDDELTYTQLAAYGNFTCGVQSDATVSCWGSKYAYDSNPAPPTPVAGAVTQLSVGFGARSCGVRAGGEVACDSQIAEPLEGPFAQVDVGQRVDCAVALDHTVHCWGLSSAGAAWEDADQPEGTFQQVSVGPERACGVKVDGTLDCFWGTTEMSAPPSGAFTQVDVGAEHVCALTVSGTVVCWSSAVSASADSLGTIPDGSFVQLSVSEAPSPAHACAVQADGAVACWGDNEFGQADPPSKIAFKQVSAGSRHTCGLRMDDTAFCWGDDREGQTTPP
jgi:alpha-tubulin suppressor-like RCC1 family protein